MNWDPFWLSLTSIVIVIRAFTNIYILIKTFESITCLGFSWTPVSINTLRPRKKCWHFADDTFECIFLNENGWISIKISLKIVPRGPINNIPALVQIMAWRWPDDKPLSEPMWLIYWRIYASRGLNKLRYGWVIASKLIMNALILAKAYLVPGSWYSSGLILTIHICPRLHSK